MEFCKKCGGLISGSDSNAKCMKCGKSAKGFKIKTSEKIEGKKSVDVVKGEEINILPVIEVDCKKCDNNKAFFWTAQTRGSDEAETRFFKCTKCKYSWRQYR